MLPFYRALYRYLKAGITLQAFFESYSQRSNKQQVKDIINASLFKISKVYITGTASVINNIDLYFEEILNGIDCQILK